MCIISQSTNKNIFSYLGNNLYSYQHGHMLTNKAENSISTVIRF